MLDEERRQAALNDSLLGWDFAYALNFSLANAAIEAGDQTPKKIDIDQGTEGEIGYAKIDGHFGSTPDRLNRHWKLIPGGSGRTVWMEMPNIEFELTRQIETGQPAVVKNFSAGTLKVSFELEFVDTNRMASNGARIFDLKVRIEGMRGGNGTPVVAIEDFTTTPDLGSDELVVNGLMADWLEAHFEDFDHVFASINVGGTPDTPGFSWLIPTSVSYAVNDTAEGSAEEDAFLAVLSMTEHRTAPQVSVALSSILPDGDVAAIAISQSRFMEKMLKAGVHVMFQEPPDAEDWPNSYFTVTNDVILTNTKDLVIPGVQFEKLSGPVDVKVPAETMSVLNAGTYLDIQFTDFQHRYEAKGIHLLNIFHAFRVLGQIELNEDGLIDLRVSDEQLGARLGFHAADAQKTETAQDIEWAVVIIDVLMLLAPFARAGWLRYAAEEPKPNPEGAELEAGLNVEGAPSPEQPAEVAAEGAGEVLKVAKEGEKATFRQILSGYFVGLWGGIMSVMTGGLIFYEIYEGIVDKNAKKNLPEATDFALTVLDPLTWPEAATPTFEVKSASLNDGLSIIFKAKA